MYLLYARSYLFLAVPITLVCWLLLFGNGPAAFGGVLFLKLVTMLIGWVVLRKRHRKDIFFYQNIGYGAPRLLAVTGAVDLGVWLLGIIAIILTCY